MNRKMVFYMFGRIGQIAALLLLLPALVAVVYGEYRQLLAFLITAAGAVAAGTVCLAVT